MSRRRSPRPPRLRRSPRAERPDVSPPASSSESLPAPRPGARLPPLHWWRTIFFLIPVIGVYTIVLGTISLVSSFSDPSGDTGHRCARTWSSWILRTTGVRVTVRGLERLDPKRSYVL